MKQKVKTTECIFEIGTEEIPSSYLDLLRDPFRGLDARAKGLLKEILSVNSVVESFQTPRRIVLYLSGLAPSYEKNEEFFGPKKEICYQNDGKPTRALEGFLKRYQATIREIGEEGGRVVIRRKKVVRTSDALKEALPELVRQLAFPKVMRWNEGDLRFPRPIRWILCLYNGKILGFGLGGSLKTGAKTWGLRVTGKQKAVKSWKEYEAFLKKEGILLERCLPEEGERKRSLRLQIQKHLKKLSAGEELNEALLSEVANLVEKPVLFVGHFDRRYLVLPKEILVASLSKYQRVFSVENKKRELLPHFVACANGSPVVSKIRENYEHVLNARLEDAIFFYETDTREAFMQKRGKLKLLVYHQKLGTMYDKSERMTKLAKRFAVLLPCDEKILIRACELSKNDLVTEMVKEFPSLQGVVGYYYAKKSGEKEDVALAIREQYLTERLPETSLGAILSFIEKLDHVVGCFYAGESPTGSSDPYGLKRAANAIFHLILSNQWKFSLNDMIDANSNLLDKLLIEQKDRGEKLRRFLTDRIKGIFKEEGYRDDLVEAVMTDIDHPVESHQKLAALKGMMERDSDAFLDAFKVVERTHNILKPLKPSERGELGAVDAALFQTEVEKNLWNIYNSERQPIQKSIEANDWTGASARYGRAFAQTLHQFFDKVMVNAQDSETRRNRLAMMKEINELYTRSIADLSKLLINLEVKSS